MGVGGWSWGCVGVGTAPENSNLQTELKYLYLFKLYYISTDLGVPTWGWVGWLDVGVGVWEVAPYMYTCAYMHTCMCSAQ